MKKQVINTDNFYNLSPLEQALYFHLLHRANEDGFVYNGQANAVVKLLRAGVFELRNLEKAGYMVLDYDGLYIVDEVYVKISKEIEA